MLGVGCWMLLVGCWVLDVGCWALGVGCGEKEKYLKLKESASPPCGGTIAAEIGTACFSAVIVPESSGCKSAIIACTASRAPTRVL